MKPFVGTIPPLKVPAIALPKWDNGHWHFEEQMGQKQYVGFIYVIRDRYMERFYLGKKTYRGAGVKNKGVESNWRKYKSSSEKVKEMLGFRPLEEFDFVVLEQYKTKGTLAYAETWSLCLVEAPTSDKWYNTLIEKVSWSVKEPISQRHKDRLDRLLRWEEFKERV